MDHTKNQSDSDTKLRILDFHCKPLSLSCSEQQAACHSRAEGLVLAAQGTVCEWYEQHACPILSRDTQRWACCITSMLPEKCQSKSCSVHLTLSSQRMRSRKTLENMERMKGRAAELSFAAQLLGDVLSPSVLTCRSTCGSSAHSS